MGSMTLIISLRVRTKLFRFNKVNIMAADAMAPCVARSAAAMILAMQNRHVLVLHEEGFQLPVSCQCGGMIKIVNTCLWFCWTRRSENDNTPQPLDQWTNSSFIGQQVGNCKSFTLTHYFANLSAMHRGRRSIPLCIQHHIQLTSLSFQVSQTSHCWVTAISIFYLENPRSRSWVRSKFEVTMWV